MSQYSIGLDYGTNSVRGLLVDVRTGEELACSVFPYPHGKAGILLDARDPDVARQHPQDYLDGAQAVIRGVLARGGVAARLRAQPGHRHRRGHDRLDAHSRGRRGSAAGPQAGV